jgi:MFS family permease
MIGGRTLQDRNILRLHLDTAVQGIGSAGTAVYLSVYLVHIGAEPFQVALLSALPALIMVLLAIPAAVYVDRHRDLVRTVVQVRFAYYLGPLAIALLLATPLGVQPLVIVGTWALFSAAFSAFQPAWMAAMPLIIPRDRMLAVTGDRWAINGAVTAIAVVTFGVLLDRVKIPFGYQIVFLTAFAASMLALFFYSGIRIPYRTVSVSATQPVVERLRAMGQAIKEHKDFQRYLLADFAFQVALWLPEGLYSVYWVRNLGASDSLIGVRTMALNLTLMCGYFIWGRMTGRLGRRRVMMGAIAAVGLYPLLTAIAPSAIWLVPVAGLRGLFFAATDIVLFEALLAKSPLDHRPAFVATANMIENSAHLAAPLLGAGLAAFWSIRVAFFIGFAVSLIAAALFRTLHLGAIRDHGERGGDLGSVYSTESK